MKVGDAVTKFKVGDEVFGVSTVFQDGTHSEYVKIAENQLHFKPKQITMYEAAAIGYAGFTANSVFDHVKTSDCVFINGGSGGVGICLIQLLKTRDCEVHITCSPKNFQKAIQFGADYVYDYRDQMIYPERFNQSIESSKFNVMIDSFPIEKKMVDYLVDKIKSDGQYINLHPFRFLSKPTFKQQFSTMMEELAIAKKFRKKKIVNGYVFASAPVPLACYSLARLSSLIEDNRLKADINQIFYLSEAIEAFEYFASSSRSGKVLLNFCE